MIVNNLADTLQVLDILPIEDCSADANGTGVDLLGYDGDLLVVLDAKNTAGTTPTMDIKLQESDASGSGYTDISGAAYTQVTDAAASVQSIKLNKDALKRYIRCVKDIGGTSTPHFMLSIKGYAMKKYPA